jgi:CBS domain-containing protein
MLLEGMSDRRSTTAPHKRGLEPASDGKVIFGRDGWLFLDMDSNQVMRQHSGLAGLSDDDLGRWQELLEFRTSRLAALGARYLLVVAPDAHSVYPEMLPGGIEVAPKRPVLQLLERLREAGSPARVLYPLEAMLAEKRAHPVYSKTDTHWNAIGSFLAYDAIAAELDPAIPIRRLGRQDLRFERWSAASDLGRKVRPTRTAERIGSRTRDVPRARLVSDNCIDNRGALIEFTCPGAPKTSCLLFGDSATYTMLQFMVETFGTLVFAHAPSVDFELVGRARWDVVISVMTERFLIQVPSDSDGPSIAALAREKRKQGRLRGPVLLTPIILRSSPGVDPLEEKSEGVRMTVGEVMGPVRADCVDLDSSVREAAGRLSELELNAIAIVDEDGRFRGMLTARALLEVIARGDDPDAVRVERFVTDQPTVTVEDPVDDVAAFMRHNKMQWLPVVDGERRIVGQLTRSVVDKHARAAATAAPAPDAGAD